MGESALDNRFAAAGMTADRGVVDKARFTHIGKKMGRISAVDSRCRQQSKSDGPFEIGGIFGDHDPGFGSGDFAVVVEKSQFKIITFPGIAFVRSPEPAFFAEISFGAFDFDGVGFGSGGVDDVFIIDIALNAGDSIDHFRKHHLQLGRCRSDALFFRDDTSGSCQNQQGGTEREKKFFHNFLNSLIVFEIVLRYHCPAKIARRKL